MNLTEQIIAKAPIINRKDWIRVGKRIYTYGNDFVLQYKRRYGYEILSSRTHLINHHTYYEFGLRIEGIRIHFNK